MKKLLGLKDSIKIGKKNKVAVSDIVNVKGEIFKYIMEGYQFDDEVLEMAHIKKTKRDVQIKIEFSEHKKRKIKEYQKDTETVKNILKSINTIDGQNLNETSFYTQNDGDEDNVLTLIEEQQEECQEEK